MAVSPTGRALKLIVTASMIRGSEILLVKYSPPVDGQGGWILPTTDISDEQNPDSVAESLLRDHLTVSSTSLQISHTEAFVGRDGTWHVVLHYFAKLDPTDELSPRPPIAEHRWFDFDQLPAPEHLAYRGWSADIAATVRSKV